MKPLQVATWAVLLTCAAGACSEDPAPADKDTAGTVSDSAADQDVQSTDDGGGDVVVLEPADKAGFDKLLAVTESKKRVIAGLKQPVTVVRTKGGVPHIYAYNKHDLYLAQGFVVAADRYFFMLMGSKLGQGRLSEILGEAAIDTDYEARSNGMAHVAKTLLEQMTTGQKEIFGAYKDGINAYVEAARNEAAPLPSEIKLAAPLIGKKPKEMLETFELSDVAGFAGVIVYQLGYETGDVGRGRNALKLDSHFKGKFEEALRRKGAKGDIWDRIVPFTSFSSAHGWGTETAPPPPPEHGKKAGNSCNSQATQQVFVRAPMALLDRLTERLDRFSRLIKRDHDKGFGSNAWAVGKGATKDDIGLLAGDGHLPLTIPSYFYQIGLNTKLLGGGDVHQSGLIIPGLPILAVGTNGDVAWCQTQLMGDITDWYVEELELDADGKPAKTLFKGKWEPVKTFEETFKIIELKSPILPSKAGTEKWQRWTTFDGRWIADIEGTKVKADHKPDKGQSVVNLGGNFVVPMDTDKDGKITAISFDYTGLDKGNMMLAVDGFGHSKNVTEVKESMRHLVAYSQNIVAADADGGVMYSGYQAVPCRQYLPRDKDGQWTTGADPSGLLDGTKYGGFTIPIKDGKVDEAPGQSDPYKCVVPFAEYPSAVNPKQGYVISANNDIGDITHDNSLTNDKWYVGGPWIYGFRAQRIADLLDEKAKTGATLADMSELQADVQSQLGKTFVPWLLKQLDDAKTWSETDGVKTPEQQRAVDLYQAMTATGVAEVIDRLKAWEKADFPARSGVETFYSKASEDDRKNAIATMIYNAWVGRFIDEVLNDEPMPGIYRFSNGTRRVTTYLVKGIGKDNPLKQASFYEPIGASIFFDRLGTDVVETPQECALKAMKDALIFLAGASKGDGTGGFGTGDQEKWLWGLRHLVKFESTIADFFSAAEGLSALTDQFAITTEKLPLLGKEKLPKGDPRLDLKWFPRQGDAFAIDAAGNTKTDGWHYGSGPVFRMAISLRRDKDGKPQVGGVNIVPGGQSALTDSPNFSDQAELWLNNKTLPLHFHVDQVVSGATGRETLTP